jgi:hypothetical protein
MWLLLMNANDSSPCELLHGGDRVGLHRVLKCEWFVQDLVENVGPQSARADVARRIVQAEPTLSLPRCGGKVH